MLAALATAGGELRVTGASELRVKESDRITSLVAGLRALGADADELPDGFHIRGTRRLTGGTVDAHDDHRLAMAFAIAGLTATALKNIPWLLKLCHGGKLEYWSGMPDPEIVIRRLGKPAAAQQRGRGDSRDATGIGTQLVANR